MSLRCWWSKFCMYAVEKYLYVISGKQNIFLFSTVTSSLPLAWETLTFRPFIEGQGSCSVSQPLQFTAADHHLITFSLLITHRKKSVHTMNQSRDHKVTYQPGQHFSFGITFPAMNMWSTSVLYMWSWRVLSLSLHIVKNNCVGGR